MHKMSKMFELSYSFLELLITEENGLTASQARTVWVQAIFSGCQVIMASHFTA